MAKPLDPSRRHLAAATAVAGVFAVTAPPAQAADAVADKNVEIVKRLYAAFGRGDVEAAVALMDDKVEWIAPGPSTIPWAGNFQGKDGVRRFFTIAVDLLAVQEHRTDGFIAQKDKVVSIGFEDHKVKASGKGYRSTWVHVYTIRKGKIVRMEEFVDTAAQAAAFAK